MKLLDFIFINIINILIYNQINNHVNPDIYVFYKKKINIYNYMVLNLFFYYINNMSAIPLFTFILYIFFLRCNYFIIEQNKLSNNHLIILYIQ